MEDLLFLYSNDGSTIITSSQRVADIYDIKGYDQSASFFDSYSGEYSRLVRGFIDKETGDVQYATSRRDSRNYKERGYSRINGSFSVSLQPGDGLKAIYELEKDGLISYVPASLRKSYKDNGYVNNGLAWYSPINNGNVRISDVVIGGGDQSAGIDEVTGNLTFDYEVDNLHSGQFIDDGNALSFRILIESVDGNVYSESLPEIDISNKTAPLIGTLSTDFIGDTGLPLEQIASINIAGVAKYGMNGSAKHDPLSSMRLDSSSISRQLDAGYTFFRGNSLELSGDDLSQMTRSNATPMKGLAPKYFELAPLYEDEKFIDRNFVGYPLQDINCLGCTFEGNNFTQADMSGFYSLRDTEKGGDTPTYGRRNPNKFNGINTVGPSRRYDTIFQAKADGNPAANAPWYVGDFTGAQMNSDSFKIKYDYEQTQGNASMVSVENLSTGGQDVKLHYLNSATMEIGSTPLSGKTRFMQSYGYRQKKYYEQGLFDVEGRVSYRGYTFDFGVRNPAFPEEASFYLKGARGAFEKQRDYGSSAFLKWEYTGLFGLKSWKLSVIDWTPSSQGGNSQDQILPLFGS